MSVAKQLYQLQDIDLEIKSTGHTMAQVTEQLRGNLALVRAQASMDAAQQHLEECQHEQRAAEWEIDDLVNKINATEESLYSGRIRDPKELTNLKHEADNLKDRRRQLEDRALEIMDRTEAAAKAEATLSQEVKNLETDWQQQQQQLSAELERLKTTLVDLKKQRQQLATSIDASALATYQSLRGQRQPAVARVEQGICRGCRISLPSTELQRVKGDHLVRCSSCGRILFLP